jgi:hypothetical protein
MKQILTMIFLALMLASCAPAATPAPLDLQATVENLSATIVAGTLTAMPTAAASSTPIPPTETPSPTETMILTETATISPEEAATGTQAVAQLTASATPLQGTFAPGGVSGKTMKILVIENLADKTAKITLTGTTDPTGNYVYYEYEVSNVLSLNDVHWGYYHFVVIVGNQTFSGDFRIQNYDKIVIKIYNNKVAVVGP